MILTETINSHKHLLSCINTSGYEEYRNKSIILLYSESVVPLAYMILLAEFTSHEMQVRVKSQVSELEAESSLKSPEWCSLNNRIMIEIHHDY